ncbi:hypothetical protein C5D13_10665 [Rathayibacter toxicus]|nr:hypothetical protein C5D13_10665 [Rathayibacter toxicus]
MSPITSARGNSVSSSPSEYLAVVRSGVKKCDGKQKLIEDRSRVRNESRALVADFFSASR